MSLLITGKVDEPFNYTIQAHLTLYKDVMFRSRLEARWAAFFDLVNWKWEYEPIDLVGWTPDFHVIVNNKHADGLYVEVKPYGSLLQFKEHAAYKDSSLGENPRPWAAFFGLNPHITRWSEYPYGWEERGVFSYIKDADTKWKQAGNITRWLPGK
jgi:hypothetical protein